MKGLAKDSDALFDEHSFTSLNSAEAANNSLRYFSQHASKFQTDLIRRGYATNEVTLFMDSLWTRIIKACKKFGVPMNPTADAQAKRLGL